MGVEVEEEEDLPSSSSRVNGPSVSFDPTAVCSSWLDISYGIGVEEEEDIPSSS